MPPLPPDQAATGALAGSALARNRLNSDRAAWIQTAFSAISRPLQMELWAMDTSSPGGQRQLVTHSKQGFGACSKAPFHDTADRTL
jgi:hypothetical protein